MKCDTHLILLLLMCHLMNQIDILMSHLNLLMRYMRSADNVSVG